MLISAPRSLFLLALGIVAAGHAEATGRKTLASFPLAQLPPTTTAHRPAPRSAAPVAVTTAAAPGQAGYVHFFVIRDKDGALETQIGIELDDQRIAWSVPNLGVVVMPFIKSGVLDANGTVFEVEHLYGVRPFAEERSMRTLRADLPWRIAPYIDDETPYCYHRVQGDPLCMSCMDFVVRVLFPGHFPTHPPVPKDFERTSEAHTTDDLLLYLLGLHGLPNQAARLKRLEQLALPDGLRRDALQLVEAQRDGQSEAVSELARTQSVAPKGRRSAQPSPPLVQPRQMRRRRS
jgi:hypothetical protein